MTSPSFPWDSAPLQLLGRIWVAIFGAGALLTAAAAFIPPFSSWVRVEPLLWSVPAGQVVLLAASLLLVRDRGGFVPGVHALCVYKLLAGIGMLSGLAHPGGTVGVSLLVAAGGGAMDLGMGGLTWALWLKSGRGAEGSPPDTSYVRPDQPGPPAAAAVSLMLVALLPGAGAAWLWGRLVLGHPPLPLSRIAVANLAGACGGISAAILALGVSRLLLRKRR